MHRSPDPGDGISVERSVRAYDLVVFSNCLRDQQAVEWIAMMKWEWGESKHVIRVSKSLGGGGAQPRIVVDEPQVSVGVEKDTHGYM